MIKPLLATWLIVNLVVVITALLVFDLPFLLTRGGPANATMTWLLHGWITLFQYFRMGYGAAMYVPLLVLCAIAVGLIWGISEWSGLRLVYVPVKESTDRKGPRWLIGLLMIPVVVIVALPILAPHLYNGITALESRGRGGSGPFETTITNLANSFAPAIPILFLAIPCAYLAALAISLLKPLGRIGSKILFLLFLWGSVIPVSLLVVPLFGFSRRAQLLNTTLGLILPYLASGVALYAFKLFFDGREGPLEQALEGGDPPFGAWWRHVLLPSLPMVVMVAAIAIMATVATEGLTWMLAATHEIRQAPVPFTIVMGIGQIAAGQPYLAAAALRWTLVNLGVGIVPAILLQILLVDRLALVCRPKE